MRKAKDNGEDLDDVISAIENLKRAEMEYEQFNKAPTPKQGSEITVLMKKMNSVYYVPCKINGIKADFIFDTGAGAISLSSYFANELIKQGKLTESDYIGEGASRIADGSVSSVIMVNIKDVEIGGLHLYNVKAMIKEQQNAPLLLGQSAIEKLGRITIDGYKLIIHRK
ncbi:MAG: retroviral-like aspartic protease family protein [Bacteroidaceae bacterium]|nr:retroviral-like aspartic protease family protein [Bacteroidaceae bacterium]